jgi:hypothetical protein
MPVWRLQTTVWFDSILPRDGLTINPHFDDHGITSDPEGLCADLAAALDAWASTQAANQIQVRAYDAQGTPPVFPQGDVIINATKTRVSPIPRELALCLSYFSGQNRPRYRGRLYMPIQLFETAVSLTVRPSGSTQSKVLAFATALKDLGGPDVDWVVYSRLDDAARPVTGYWVDDEWDVVRSRGLRSSARLTGSASE